MSAHMDKEATMNSLEMDREVIRCKTCGLVQYRTRTGNCRRCVRALPQRMEYLIPQEAPQEEVAPEDAVEEEEDHSRAEDRHEEGVQDRRDTIRRNLDQDRG